MSIRMKIGDFIERVNNLDFKSGTKIKFQDKIYLYDYPNLTGIYEIGKQTKKEYSIFAQLDLTNLHCEVEIIEDEDNNRMNIYNIKELKVEQVMGENLEDTEFDQYYINGFHIGQQGDELTYAIENIANKVNELVRAINQLNLDFSQTLGYYVENELNKLNKSIKGE